MSILDALLDARRGISEQVAESFNSSLHPRGHPGNRGQFRRTLSSVVSKTPAPVRPVSTRGGGPGLAQGRSGRQQGAGEKPSVPRNLVGRTSSQQPGRTYGQLARPYGGGAAPAKLSEKELRSAVGTGPWTAKVNATVRALRAGSVEDTENAHRAKLPNGKLGPYAPERIELHARIARALLQGAGSHARAQAIFMAGGPASGKSSLLKSGAVRIPGDAVDVNPDIVRTMLPEYAKLLAAGDKAAAAKTHEEASHIAKMVMNLAIARQHHVVVDGTGNSGPGKFAGKVRAAMAAGYDTRVFYATIDAEEAVNRSEARAANPKSDSFGRTVPVGYLRACHRDVSKRFMEDVAKIETTVEVYDTSGKRPVLAWKRSRSQSGTVVNAKAYAAFQAKAAKDVSDANA